MARASAFLPNVEAGLSWRVRRVLWMVRLLGNPSVMDLYRFLPDYTPAAIRKTLSRHKQFLISHKEGRMAYYKVKPGARIGIRPPGTYLGGVTEGVILPMGEEGKLTRDPEKADDAVGIIQRIAEGAEKAGVESKGALGAFATYQLTTQRKWAKANPGTRRVDPTVREPNPVEFPDTV